MRSLGAFSSVTEALAERLTQTELATWARSGDGWNWVPDMTGIGVRLWEIPMARVKMVEWERESGGALPSVVMRTNFGAWGELPPNLAALDAATADTRYRPLGVLAVQAQTPFGAHVPNYLVEFVPRASGGTTPLADRVPELSVLYLWTPSPLMATTPSSMPFNEAYRLFTGGESHPLMPTPPVWAMARKYEALRPLLDRLGCPASGPLHFAWARNYPWNAPCPPLAAPGPVATIPGVPAAVWPEQPGLPTLIFPPDFDWSALPPIPGIELLRGLDTSKPLPLADLPIDWSQLPFDLSQLPLVLAGAPWTTTGEVDLTRLPIDLAKVPGFLTKHPGVLWSAPPAGGFRTQNLLGGAPRAQAPESTGSSMGWWFAAGLLAVGAVALTARSPS